MILLAIDPGNIESAYVVVDEDYKPLEVAKVENEQLNKMLPEIIERHNVKSFAFEMIASYGMAVGAEVFETCLWIGRFLETVNSTSVASLHKIYRKDEKMVICGTMRAKDANIRRALIDRFAEHDFKNGKGTKKKPDWFFGFKADCWAAFAVAVACREREA